VAGSEKPNCKSAGPAISFEEKSHLFFDFVVHISTGEVKIPYIFLGLCVHKPPPIPAHLSQSDNVCREIFQHFRRNAYRAHCRQVNPNTQGVGAGEHGAICDASDGVMAHGS